MRLHSVSDNGCALESGAVVTAFLRAAGLHLIHSSLTALHLYLSPQMFWEKAAADKDRKTPFKKFSS